MGSNSHELIQEQSYCVVGAEQRPSITPGGLLDSAGKPIGGILFSDALSGDAIQALTKVVYAKDTPVEKSQQFDNVYGLGPNLWQRSLLADHKAATCNWDSFLNNALPSGTLERPLELLRSLAPEYRVERLKADNQELPYLTIRVMAEGGCLGTHAHLDFYTKGSLYADHPILAGLMPSFELSCLLMLQHPDSGGELRLFNAMYPSSVENLASASQQTIDMAIGSLLVFDAARIYHEVTPVVGQDRITAGFWLSFYNDKRGLCAWS